MFRQLSQPVRDGLSDAVAVVLALAAAVGTLVATRLDGPPDAPAWWWVDLFGGIVAAGALAWRRKQPIAVAGLIAVIELFAATAGIASLLALLNLAIRSRVRWAVGFTLLTMITPPVPDWLRGQQDSVEGYLQTALLILVVSTAAIACGLAVRSRRELLASLVERAERAEAEQRLRAQNIRQAERNRIAREMHDVLAHRIALLNMHAGALAHRRSASAEETAAAAEVIRGSAREAMQDLRVLLDVLRNPSSLDDGADAGTEPDAPQPRLSDLDPLLADLRAAGMDIDARVDVADPAEVPELSARTLYRVAQEALTNAAKHAAGAPVRLRLSSRRDCATLEVSNPTVPGADGLGGAGKGLVGITERVNLAGGELLHCGPETADGSRRFRVAVRLPLAR